MALAIDTNIFVYALNSDSDLHERARSFVCSKPPVEMMLWLLSLCW